MFDETASAKTAKRVILSFNVKLWLTNAVYLLKSDCVHLPKSDMFFRVKKNNNKKQNVLVSLFIY